MKCTKKENILIHIRKQSKYWNQLIFKCKGNYLSTKLSFVINKRQALCHDYISCKTTLCRSIEGDLRLFLLLPLIDKFDKVQSNPTISIADFTVSFLNFS